MVALAMTASAALAVTASAVAALAVAVWAVTKAISYLCDFIAGLLSTKRTSLFCNDQNQDIKIIYFIPLLAFKVFSFASYF